MDPSRVVVIGGTSGVGFAVAEAAAEQGDAVVVASRRRNAVDRALAALGEGAEGDVLDVTDEGQVRAFFDRLGAFDHLVYTAGEPLLNRDLAETSIEEVRAFFNIRYFGALTAVKYGAPHIRPGGSIVVTSGTASFRPLRGTTAPSSVFGAIESMMRALAVELAPIRVNAVVGGPIRSELWSAVPEADREAMFRQIGENMLVGSQAGEASDLAGAFVFLMRTGHITGSSITIDGGLSLV